MLGAAALALALGNGHAVEVDARGRLILAAEEVAACNAEGGCALVTVAYMLKVNELVERLSKERDEASQRCGRDWKPS